MKYEFLI